MPTCNKRPSRVEHQNSNTQDPGRRPDLGANTFRGAGRHEGRACARQLHLRDRAEPPDARRSRVPPACAEAQPYRRRRRPHLADVPECAGRTMPTLARFSAPISAAVYDRDPACTRFLDPLLYFKGFHALVTHRFAHALWKRGRRDFALYLQSQSSRMFGVDIHPAAHFGKGIMLDHATGLVVGETASVGDNCSFLHAVTLGGSGKEKGDRHPKIGDNVLDRRRRQGAWQHQGRRRARASPPARSCCRTFRPNVTVAGVPAKIVGSAGCAEPALSMEQGWVDNFGGL